MDEKNIPTLPNEVTLKPQTEESLSKKIGLFLIDFLQTFIIAAGIFVLVYHFLCQPNQVLGASMELNLENGQYILTDKLTYRFNAPSRGDVVVFKYPGDPSLDYIKRVIGLPGEEVLIHSGHVYIFNAQNPQGVELKENYLMQNVYTDGGTKFPPDTKTVIPADSYFVLGDNREKSSDSRAWGTVPTNDIIGKAVFRYWPLSKFGLIK